MKKKLWIIPILLIVLVAVGLLLKHDLQQKRVELDLTLGFSIREWEGKEFNKVKLYNISQKIS